MRKIILDANFLILPFQFNVDIFSEFDRLIGEFYEVYTLNRTYNEALSVKNGQYRNMVERLVTDSDPEITIMETEADDDVDDVLVRLAGDYIIATNDSQLRERLRKQGLPHIFLRQKNHLEAQFLENAVYY